MSNTAIEKVNSAIDKFYSEIKQLKYLDLKQFQNKLKDENQFPDELKKMMTYKYELFKGRIDKNLYYYFFNSNAATPTNIIVLPSFNCKNKWATTYKNITNNLEKKEKEQEKTINDITSSGNIKIAFTFAYSLGSFLLLLHSTWWLLICIPLLIRAFAVTSDTNYNVNSKISEQDKLFKRENDNFLSNTFQDFYSNEIFPTLEKNIETNRQKIKEQLNNSKINYAWEFYDKGQKIISSFNKLPAKLSLFALNNFISNYDAERVADLYEAERITEENVGLYIEEIVRERSEGLEEKINNILTQDIKNVIKEYLNYAKEMANKLSYSNTLAISKKDVENIIENSLKDTLNISNNLNVASENLELMTNTIVGAGTIGAGILSGGAGMALIASGPVGWLAGAVIGGIALATGKNVIKGALQFFGFGLNRSKIERQVEEIRGNFSKKVKESISSQIGNVRRKMDDVNYNIAKEISKQ